MGGDLRIESVQDIATYRERSENSGVGVTVPIAGGNLGVNGSRGEVRIDASHASVTEQSGLFAVDGGGLEGAAGSLVSGMVMSDLDQSISDADLPEGVKQALGMAAASTLGAAVGGVSGAAAAFNVDVNNRQLHSFERSLAEELAKESPFTTEQIEAAMREMYNQELGETPLSNRVVDVLGNMDNIDDVVFDHGAQWAVTQDADGVGRYLVQMPQSVDPETMAYIIEQTGGELSPYYTVDRTLPPERATPGQERDRLTGRPLDENGQYTVSQLINGKIVHLKYWPCGNAECIASNAGLDTESGDYDAWQREMNIKLLRDASTAGTAALMVTPVGWGASAINYSAVAAGLYADYSDNQLFDGMAELGITDGFQSLLRIRGVPEFAAQQITSAISVSGGFDAVVGAMELPGFPVVNNE